MTANAHRAGRGADKRGENFDGAGFSSAIWTDEAEDRALWNIERNAVNSLRLAITDDETGNVDERDGSSDG